MENHQKYPDRKRRKKQCFKKFSKEGSYRTKQQHKHTLVLNPKHKEENDAEHSILIIRTSTSPKIKCFS